MSCGWGAQTRASEGDSRVTEHHTSERCTTTSIVDDLLDDALDVTCIATNEEVSGVGEGADQAHATPLSSNAHHENRIRLQETRIAKGDVEGCVGGKREKGWEAWR